MKMTVKAWSPVLLVAWAAVGCAGNAASEPPPATPAAATQAPEDAETSALREHHLYHHGGEGLFITMSLDTLGVSPEQRAQVDKIRGDLRRAMVPLRAAQQRLLATLAEGLTRGTIDVAAVNADVGDIASAAAAVHDALPASLNDLHAVLTPPQRAALADKVEAHWAIWRAENDQAAAGAPAGGAHGHLATLSAELDLSPQQQDQIRATLQSESGGGLPPFDRERAGNHLHEVAESFRQESFDARAAGQGQPPPGLAAWGAAHMARVVEAMNPVLTADQRTRLAQKLLEHSSHANAADAEGRS